MEHAIDVRLATTVAVVEGVRTRVWCSELYVDGQLHEASPWTSSVADAIKAQRDLRESALSDLAYREARLEAYRLFHAA